MKKLTVNMPNSSKDAIVDCFPHGLFRNKAVYEIPGLKKDELRGEAPKNKLETLSQVDPVVSEVTPEPLPDTLFDTENL